MAKHWIQSAIKHPGAEKRAASKAGESTHEYMENNKHKGGKAGARARLGLTLEGMHNGKHKALKERTENKDSGWKVVPRTHSGSIKKPFYRTKKNGTTEYR